MSRGVYRNKNYDGEDGTADKLKDLFGGNGTYAHVLSFAAYIGLEHQKKTPLKISDRNGDAVDLTIFDKQRLTSHVYSIPFIGMGYDVQAIIDGDKSVETFESYANAGMKIIHKLIQDHPTDTNGAETIISLVREMHSENMKAINKA
jgi:dnd system-associated protein 4